MYYRDFQMLRVKSHLLWKVNEWQSRRVTKYYYKMSHPAEPRLQWNNQTVVYT